MKKSVNRLFALLTRKTPSESRPLSMHHPGAAARPADYTFPPIFSAYLAAFPDRVSEELFRTRPDPLNDNLLDGEIKAIYRAACDQLVQQRSRHLETVKAILARNEAFILENKGQICLLDKKIEAINQAVDALDRKEI